MSPPPRLDRPVRPTNHPARMSTPAPGLPVQPWVGLAAELRESVAVLMGPSGAGKSSLINALRRLGAGLDGNPGRRGWFVRGRPPPPGPPGAALAGGGGAWPGRRWCAGGGDRGRYISVQRPLGWCSENERGSRWTFTRSACLAVE